MKLFGIETRGLPAVHSVDVYALDMPTVDVMLAVPERRGVERWAKRLGVQVTEAPVRGFGIFSPARHIAAVRERDGIRLEVWVRVPDPNPDSDHGGPAACDTGQGAGAS